MDHAATASSNIVLFSTRFVARAVERALGLFVRFDEREIETFVSLDVIYEEKNDKDFKIQEWRHSADQLKPMINIETPSDDDTSD